MSIDALRAACADTRARGHAHHVYILLANHANANTGRCDPSTATLAREAGIKQQTVCNAIAELEHLGCITAIRRPGRATRYILNLQPLPETAVVNHCRKRQYTTAENGSGPLPKTAVESGSNQERTFNPPTPLPGGQKFRRSKIPSGTNPATVHLTADGTRSTRDRTLAEDLNDHSWADS